MNNVVEKFKKGHKIHIKESQKGSFTKWCGGNVTNECIQRGKNSSNPKIRKKATFAQNARRWKHRKGGILKASFGQTLNKIGDWFKNNKDTISNITSIGGNILNGIRQNKTLNQYDKMLDTQRKADLVQDRNQSYWDYLNKIYNTEPTVDSQGNITNHSDIEYKNRAWNYANNNSAQINNDYAQKKAQLGYMKNQNTSNMLSNVGSLISTGLDFLNSKKNSKIV